jgi:peptidoglycan/xylan/chitin deacetylase (PgdA/CDA1 family)
MVYPTISGRALSFDALQALAKFPDTGGTLIGVDVEGGGINGVFGFSKVDSGRTRHQILFDKTHPLAKIFDDPREQIIQISDPKSGESGLGSDGYIDAKEVIARFDDGTAAITSNRVGTGHTYAFGIDLGFFLSTGYNNREQGVSRSYVNEYEPTLDVLLRLLLDMYREGEATAVTLDTVPQGKALATLITHDIDYGISLTNSAAYADFETSAGIHATYFIQTKYVRDWNDEIFYNDAAASPLRHLRELGMEIASHSVAHSAVFNHVPLGSGDERYPKYQPFVRDKTHTENATVLGELRVSRFLLENFLPDYKIESFRPGHLRNPYTLPQALAAAGYRYSSSVTANNSLTHLPFRLNYGREIFAESSIYEFPVSIEDEEKPILGDRVPQALALAEHLSHYGGLLVVLIHPNITDHKLKFEKQLVAALQQNSWFGTMREFGEFWKARDNVQVDIEKQESRIQVSLISPELISGLTLHLPAGFHVTSTEPMVKYSQSNGRLTLAALSGTVHLVLERD